VGRGESHLYLRFVIHKGGMSFLKAGIADLGNFQVCGDMWGGGKVWGEKGM